MKKRFKVLIALSLTIPMALLFLLMADAVTVNGVQANETVASFDLSSPATAVGYGKKTVKLKVGQTKKVTAARKGEEATDLEVDDPTIVFALFVTSGNKTRVRITGKKKGTTFVSWKIDGGPRFFQKVRVKKKEIKVKVGKTIKVTAARKGETVTGVPTVDDTNIASATFETKGGKTKIRILGVAKGTTFVSWVRDGILLTRTIKVK